MIKLSFFSHILELKWRVYYLFVGYIITLFTSYSFSGQIISLLSRPLLKFLTDDSSDLIFVNIFEVFNTYINVALYTSAFLYGPSLVYLIFVFIRPGLYNYEKKFCLYIFKVFIQLILISFILSYYIIIPSILFFLLTLDIIISSDFIVLKMQTKIYDYIMFLCHFIALYCVTFCEFFLFMISSIYFKLFDAQFLINKRKFIIIFCLVVGCIFSSPDLFSLFVTSVPLILLFEIILFLLILQKKYQVS